MSHSQTDRPELIQSRLRFRSNLIKTPIQKRQAPAASLLDREEACQKGSTGIHEMQRKMLVQVELWNMIRRLRKSVA
jgi:hypothetical protein